MQIDPQRSVPDLVGEMPWARWIFVSYGLDVAAWGVPLEVACVRAGVPLATVLVALEQALPATPPRSPRRTSVLSGVPRWSAFSNLP